MRRALRNRILTSVIAAPAALFAIFAATDEIVFALFFAAFFVAAIEFVRLAQLLLPTAPLRSLWVFIPLSTLLPFLALRADAQGPLAIWWIVGLGLVMAVATGSVLLSATDIKEGLAAIGVMAFAIPYFSVPPLALYRLKQIDPWWIVLLLSIVWLGDTTAYFVGRRFGRHKLAPMTSPNKTWQGAAASLAAALVATAVWSWYHLHEIPLALLGVAVVTSVAAQIGDLVESLIKRGAGVKDSSNILPGHGGFFDRLDAMFLSTPLFFGGIWFWGLERLGH